MDIHSDHDDHGGLDRDLPHLLDRRQALRWMGGVSLAGLLVACGLDGDSAESSSPAPATTTTPATTTPAAPAATSSTTQLTALTPDTTTTAPTDTAAPGAEIPDETAGPFPADGSNGPNVLADDGVVRADLTTSFGGLTGTADGVPAVFQLAIVDAASGTPLPGAVVYLWHCTADGRYSIYEIADENYLRGAGVADDAGRVAFTSVFPGCYRGRWPHCHFEVYPSLAEATSGGTAIKTSQLALPQADCEVVYTDPSYGNSAANLARLSLDTDNVFRDGWSEQLATVAGSTDEGFTASLLVRV